MYAHPLNMKISKQTWADTIEALHSWHMPILCLQHTYTTYHQFVCYFLVIPIMFNYYKMLNQSYIYKLVWKMQVNCQCYTPDVLRVFTLNLSLQKIQCADYECQLVIYKKKPKECKHRILKNKCVIYLHVFYSDELIPLFEYIFQIDTL